MALPVALLGDYRLCAPPLEHTVSLDRGLRVRWPSPGNPREGMCVWEEALICPGAATPAPQKQARAKGD